MNGPSLIDSLFGRAVEKEALLQDPIEKLFIVEDRALIGSFEASRLYPEMPIAAYFAKKLAFHLIDEKGNFSEAIRLKAITLLSENRFSYGPFAFDFTRSHLHFMLTQLKEEKLKKAINRISGPFPKASEMVIRKTVGLSEKESLTNAHARRALLSALLTPLRQKIGSCFATATAIFIQKEETERFIAEMSELISLNQLRRVVGGKEVGIPLSLSSGQGELATPFLLWEKDLFTLASSPALQSALLDAKVISFDRKKEEIIELLKPIAHEISKEPFSLWSAERLLKEILLTHFRVKEEEVEKEREREGRERSGSPLAIAPSKKKSKAALFIAAFDLAKESYVAMSENHLLRAWEYTIASFAESKGDFATWNLYHSLGLNPDETGGIGDFSVKFLEEHLSNLQEKINLLDSNYERLNVEMISLEKNLAQDSYYQAAYFAKKIEVSHILSERELYYHKARKISSFFPFLLSFFRDKFKEYFQEIYDPVLGPSKGTYLDDRPAGFRLYYKHGRVRPDLWTPILSPSLFIESLVTFFIAVESELSRAKETEDISDIASDLTTSLISFVKERLFLPSCFERLYRFFNETLPPDFMEEVNRLKRTPWSYISGGNLETFITSYFPFGDRFKKIECKIENPTELLAFYIDVSKDFPISQWTEFSKDQEKSLLAYSPTHAFLFKPGWLKEPVESDLFTLSWIREHLIKRQEHFLFAQMLNREKISFLLDLVEERLIPKEYRHLFRRTARNIGYPLSPMEFRELLLKTLSYEWWMKGKSERALMAKAIDTLLYESLPLYYIDEAKEKLPLIFEEAKEIDPALKRKIFSLIKEHQGEFQGKELLSSDQLFQLAEGFLVAALEKSKSAIDYRKSILSAMERLEFTYPPPLLFADSNWVDVYFGFALNPGTAQLELFGFDFARRKGFPMAEWKSFLDGTNPGVWGLFRFG